MVDVMFSVAISLFLVLVSTILVACIISLWRAIRLTIIEDMRAERQRKLDEAQEEFQIARIVGLADKQVKAGDEEAGNDN